VGSQKLDIERAIYESIREGFPVNLLGTLVDFGGRNEKGI
jgi:hypothetical protein